MINNRRHQSKKGFTIVELLVVILVIGIVLSMTAWYSAGQQRKAMHELNQASAATIIQQAEAFRRINGPDNLYPTSQQIAEAIAKPEVCTNPNAPQVGCDLIVLLDDEIVKQLSVDPPSAGKPKILQYQGCYSEDETDPDSAIGVKINFFDPEKDQIKSLSTGQTDAKPGVVCR